MNKQKLEELKLMANALSNSVSGFDAQIGAIQSALDAELAAGDETTEPTPVSDKIYTQADLDAAVNAAVLPLQGVITGLQQQINDLSAGMAGQIEEAVTKMKADIAAKYAEMQVVESQAETGFAELLK
jgi:hypothetical protein